MERREFIRVATTATVAAGGANAGVPDLMRADPGSVPAPTLESAPDMRAYCATFDAGMKRIEGWSLTKGRADFTGDREEADSLARAALQALYVTGMLGDLPLEAQVDAGFQRRMHAALPKIDDAVARMTAYLKSRTEADFTKVHAAFRQTNAGTRIADALDAEAALSGVSKSRRAHMRTMLTQIEWRLTYQSPSLLVNEYLDKAEKLVASDIDMEARKQWLIEKVGPRLLGSGLVPRDGTAPPPRRRDGGKTMAIGFIVLASGALIVALGAFPGVFVMTVGAVMMLVGLISLMVS